MSAEFSAYEDVYSCDVLFMWSMNLHRKWEDKIPDSLCAISFINPLQTFIYTLPILIYNYIVQGHFQPTVYV